MLKSKRSIIVLISAAMVMSVFAGCGKKAETQTQTQTQAQGGNTSTQSGNTTSAPAQNNAPKPTLKALVTYKSGMDYNNYPVQKFLEEKTGYKVQYDVLPQDNAMDKLNVVIASGQEYDFISIYDKARYGNYAQQGALVDLEPLVKQYGPNIVKGTDPVMLDNIRIDGKYYAIPSISPSGRPDSTNVGMGIMVRKDWLDKLGLKMPTTTDEFTNMLQAIKDKDPNGNGAKNIPLTVDQGMGLDGAGLGGAFGIPTGWIDVNSKLINKVEMPGFKEYILYLKDLYNKGLLDKEAPTNQGSTAREKYTSGRAAAFHTHWADIPTIGDTMNKTQPEAKNVYMPPLSGKLGKGALPGGDPKNAIDIITMVPKSSKHAVDVIKYINEKLVEETFKEMVIGQENVHHTVKDGGFYPIIPKFFDDRGNANLFLTGSTLKYGTYWLARLRKDDRLYQGWKELNVDYASAVVIDPVSKAPVLEKNTKYAGSLGKLTSDFIVKSVAGDFSDATLAAFIAQWKSAGGEEVIKEVNDWYSKSKK